MGETNEVLMCMMWRCVVVRSVGLSRARSYAPSMHRRAPSRHQPRKATRLGPLFQWCRVGISKDVPSRSSSGNACIAFRRAAASAAAAPSRSTPSPTSAIFAVSRRWRDRVCREFRRNHVDVALKIVSDFFRQPPDLRNAFLGSLDHNDAHVTQPPLTTMPSKSLSDAAKRARRKARVAPGTDTLQSAPQEAIPGLPDHLVVALILRSEYFDDPADLARLPAVSRAMRDAVSANGLRFAELAEVDAVMLGCLSAVQRLQRGGHLSREEYLCVAAARGGHLEELKLLRADGVPWDECTCGEAARGGHLDVMQWLHANGCQWGERTSAYAALDGHLEGLQWMRANGCPWDGRTCSWAATEGHLDLRGGGAVRATGGAEVVARERLPVGQDHVRLCGIKRPARVTTVGARERLPMGRAYVLERGGVWIPRAAAGGAHERLPVEGRYVHGSGDGRTSRGAAVVARERMPVGRIGVHVSGGGRAPRGAAVVARERMPVGREDVCSGGGGWTPRGAAVVARKRLPVGRADVWVGKSERAHGGV